MDKNEPPINSCTQPQLQLCEGEVNLISREKSAGNLALFIYWLSVVTSLSVVDNVSACVYCYTHKLFNIIFHVPLTYSATCIPRKVSLYLHSRLLYRNRMKFHYSKIECTIICNRAAIPVLVRIAARTSIPN